MRSARVWVVLLFLTTSSTALAATKAIKFGTLVDGTGRVFTNAVVIVEDDQVQSIASGNAPVPSGAEIIDLSRYTGIPGLIDAHTHITYYWDPASGTRPLNQPSRDPSLTADLAFANARRTLETGVTTIRDLGASRGIDYAMRDAINAGTKVGPRMFVAGQGISAIPAARSRSRIAPAVSPRMASANPVCVIGDAIVPAIA